MKNFNILCLLMVCALIFMAVSCVNATDVNDTSISVHDDSAIPVNDQATTPLSNQTPIEDTVSVEKNIPTTVTVANDMKNPEKEIPKTTQAKDNHGSMTELKNQLKFIKSGSTYTFTKDYQFVKGKDIIHALVIMGNNVVIDGNGHTIDGKNLMDHLIISGNKVTIKNLTITHFKNRNNCPIEWNGNNGVLRNCTLTENSGIMGGAIVWNGINGAIRNSNFKNNTTQKIAGAIYIKGENMNVENSTFTNCGSKIVGEAIYVSPNVKHWKVTGTFNNVNGIVDGSKTNIKLDFLSKTHETRLNENNIYTGSFIFY